MAIMAELHQEHVNLTRLLDMLDRKIEKLRDGTHPNFQLMADVVDYVGGYADTYHHPREDRMFEFFKGRDAAADELMSTCEQEHVELKHQSTHLSEVIEGVLHDATVVPLEQLVDQLEAFVKREKAHLDFEESKVFPALEKLASEKDWSALDEQLPTPADPLFGAKQSEEYRELYNALYADIRSDE